MALGALVEEVDGSSRLSSVSQEPMLKMETPMPPAIVPQAGSQAAGGCLPAASCCMPVCSTGFVPVCASCVPACAASSTSSCQAVPRGTSTSPSCSLDCMPSAPMTGCMHGCIAGMTSCVPRYGCSPAGSRASVPVCATGKSLVHAAGSVGHFTNVVATPIPAP